MRKGILLTALLLTSCGSDKADTIVVAPEVEGRSDRYWLGETDKEGVEVRFMGLRDNALSAADCPSGYSPNPASGYVGRAAPFILGDLVGSLPYGCYYSATDNPLNIGGLGQSAKFVCPLKDADGLNYQYSVFCYKTCKELECD